MKTVSFIPIKLTNQRLPGKNTLPLNNRPLCDYILQTLKSLDGIDEKYVFCSDEQIKPYIPQGVNFLQRDPYLDGPQIKGTEIIAHFVAAVNADIYIITHATQPFTKAESIAMALEKVKSGSHDSAFAAVALQDYCWYKGKPLNYSLDNVIVTQNLEPVYMETGAFFIFKKEVFTQTGRRIGENPYMHIVDSFEAIDIDTADDFKLAEIAAKYLQDL
ncbi:MAG: NTP transferase domain-containing protein [Defluviitaleaceae bacterium]|nr:NTP transferase domain-containing protein [Defluviitaleaceae bacterium]